MFSVKNVYFIMYHSVQINKNWCRNWIEFFGMKYLSHKVQSKLSLGIAIKELYGFKENKSDVFSVQKK